MQVISEQLLEVFTTFIGEPQARSERWISTSVSVMLSFKCAKNERIQAENDANWTKLCSAQYHANNVISPVLFRQAIAKVLL